MAMQSEAAPDVTPQVKLLDIEAMCFQTPFPARISKIVAFASAVRALLPPDNPEADEGHKMAMFGTPGLPDLGSTTTSFGTHQIARNAVRHGVPVATINFLAAIHLAP